MRKSKILLASFGLISSVFVFGCASKDATPAAVPCVPFDYMKYTPSGAALTLTTDIFPIIKTSCSLTRTCHGSTSAAMADHDPQLGPQQVGPKDMAGFQAVLTALMGMAKEAPALQYVKPMDPENSWLMKKVEGDNSCTGVACVKIPEAPSACGDTMPQGGDLLAPAQQAKFRDWIKGGANL